MNFDKKYFQSFKFTQEDINLYFKNASRDFNIAETDNIAEVKFTFAYQALIKGGIALIAKVGKVKIRSVPGHHVKIVEAISEILKEETILTIGNAMRMKRNLDLYSGSEIITEKEANEYLKFIETVLKKIEKLIS